MNKKYFRILFLITISICSTLFFDNIASASIIKTDNLEASSITAVDLDSGQFLFAQKSNEEVGIASLTKLIVIDMVYDKIKENKIKLNDEITVDNKMSELSNEEGLTDISVKAGQKITIEDLIKRSIILSSNSSCTELAEKICGSQQNFINEAEKRLNNKYGIITNIYTSSGLTNGDVLSYKNKNISDQSENILNSSEMTKIYFDIIKRHPEILKYSKMKSLTVNGKEYQNVDPMTSSSDFTGIKTGNSAKYGESLVCVTKVNGINVLITILGVKNNNNQNGKAKLVNVANEVRQNLLNYHKISTKQTIKKFTSRYGQKVTYEIPSIEIDALKNESISPENKIYDNQIYKNKNLKKNQSIGKTYVNSLNGMVYDLNKKEISESIKIIKVKNTFFNKLMNFFSFIE